MNIKDWFSGRGEPKPPPTFVKLPRLTDSEYWQMGVAPPIYVWCCCGALGYNIPFADWVASNIIPVAYYWNEPYVYVYSIKGQLGDPIREQAVTPGTPKVSGSMPIADVCIDDYIDPKSLRVDWDGVRSRIKREHNRWKEKQNAK